MDYDALLDLGTELGYKLVLSGAEIYRVEESVLRLLTAYGLQPQVFALPSCLIVSVNTPSGHPITQMRRVPPHGTDIELLERCNELCRRLCREVPPLPEAAEQVRKLGQDHRAYPTRILLLGYAAAAAFFTAFYGGTLLDTLCGGLCGLAVGLWMLWAIPRLRFNNLFQTLIGAAIASLLALILVHMGIGGQLEAITIGTLMVLVPGMALTNAMREIMAGDIFSGLSRTAESILTATAIALGVMVSLAIGN